MPWFGWLILVCVVLLLGGGLAAIALVIRAQRRLMDDHNPFPHVPRMPPYPADRWITSTRKKP